MANDTRLTLADVSDRVREEWERKTLLDYLRKEIDRIESDFTRPGWTVWALYAATAALFAYFFSTLDANKHHWDNVGILFVAICIALDCLRWLAIIIQDHRPNEEDSCRFELIGACIIKSRLFITTMLARTIVLYAVYHFTHFQIGPYYTGSIILFLCLNICLVSLMLIFSMCNLPMRKSIKTKRRSIYFGCIGIWIGLGVISVIGIVKSINVTATSIQDYQLAASLCALSYVVLFLTKTKHEPALLDDLRAVERRLVLGQIMVEDAKLKTDRLLCGLTLGDVMKDSVQKALHDIEVLETEQTEFNDELAILRKIIGDPHAEMSKERETTVTAILRDLSAKANQVVSKKDISTKSLAALQKRAQMVRYICPEIADEMQNLLKQVDDALDRVGKALGTAQKGLQEIQNAFKKGAEQVNKA